MTDLHTAAAHYEAALREAFPSGATGDVFHHWNEARKLVANARELGLGYEPEQPAQQEPVAAECKFDREEKWVRCEIAHHNLVQSEPHKWPGYQTRLLYTRPQERDWVGLTDEDHKQAIEVCLHIGVEGLVFWLEAKLREKNA